MKIELHSLHIQSIRDLDLLNLDFGSPSHHLTTIQMPNGTGKTTTLYLLKCLFSGMALPSQKVAELRPTLFDADEGFAKMTVTIDDSPYTIELKLNYEEESYQYSTRSPDIGGHEEGHHIPPKYRLTPELVNLFVFDGEDVSKDLFMSSSRTAEQAIDCLYGLSKVEDLIKKVDKQKQVVKDNSKTKITKTSTLNQKRARLVLLNDCKDRIEAEIKADQKRIVEIDEKLKPIQEELNQLQNPEIRQKLELLEKDIDQGETNIETETQKLRVIAVNPMIISDYFSDALLKLKENMDILKLPRGTSSEFFQELCESDSCICGTKMTPEVRKAIMTNSSKYLSDDLAGIMNGVKTEISTWKDNTDTFKEMVSNISALKRKLNDDKEKHAQLEKTFGGKDSQKRYAALLEQKTKLEQEKDNCKESIAFSTDPYINKKDSETNLTLCLAEIKALKEEIGKGDDLVRKLGQCDKAHILLNQIYTVAMKNLKQYVINLTNETIFPIMGDEIVVKSIDKSIILKNKPIGSEGQVLTIGYAYISALFKDSEFRLPFIIDSPCGSLDLDKRAYVARKIPRLFDQMVLFVTSSERLRFTDVLEKEENLNQYTVWKEKKDGTLIQKSQDPVFFNNFQMNDEEE